MKDSSTATERVGRYQLLEPIGGGPNGMVARAKVFGVAGFERQFAVKRFLPELTVGAIAQALSAAARSYGSLEHPRIARMSEFGVAQGQTFTAVEYVAGLDASRLMTEAKLAGVAIAAGGALALVSQAARAVGYAHGRGLSHLGLSPTNVIVTADGDVKVTDFGILAATMPPNPIEIARLALRVPYLAPEQLAGEATSAATDVFVLGVIAYELVTGQRAYRGETPPQIAQAIMAGPPAEPPLPRPIVRVLQRCLARSPFERFPDARALADALDAALRVAPVPGTRKDIGAQIKTTLDRYATLNEGNLSGMVALNLQTAGLPAASPDSINASTQEFLRPGAPTEPSPMPVVSQSDSPASTLREMPKPFSTVPGIAPPPIPVPPGVTPPPNQSSGLAGPGGPPKTMLGMSAAKKAQIPSIAPRPNGPPLAPPKPPPAPPPGAAPGKLTMGWDAMPEPPPPPSDVIEEPSGLIEIDDPPTPAVAPAEMAALANAAVDDGTMPKHDPSTMQGVQPPRVATGRPIPRPTPGQNFESTTGEMSPLMLDKLNRRSVMNTGEIKSVSEPAADPHGGDFAAEDAVGVFATDASAAPASTMPGMAPAQYGAPEQPAPEHHTAPAYNPPPHQPTPAQPATSKSGAPMAAIAVLVLGVLGAGGYFAYTNFIAKKAEPTQVAAGSGSAKVVEAGSAEIKTGSAEQGSAEQGSADQGSAEGSAAVPTTTPDAAVQVAAVPDAAVEKPPEVAKPTGSSDSLQITSKPRGARVFIDGADQGATPVKLPGSTDRHTVAVLLPGHDLYVAEVDGKGVFNVELKPVTPSGGHAGIKVLKCKAKERYYVYVDGTPTGMTCPTERIDTTIGPHTVEVYDIVTETRRKFDIVVKDDRLSVRVRIDD